MTRWISLVICVVFIGGISYGDAVTPSGLDLGLVSYLTATYESDQAAQAVALGLISRYLTPLYNIDKSPRKRFSNFSKSDFTFDKYDKNQNALRDQVQKLVDKLNKDLGPRIQNSEAMQMNLDILLTEMTYALESNIQSNRDFTRDYLINSGAALFVVVPLIFAMFYVPMKNPHLIAWRSYLTFGLSILPALVIYLGFGKLLNQRWIDEKPLKLEGSEPELYEQIEMSRANWCSGFLKTGRD